MPSQKKPTVLVCEANEGLQEAFHLMLDEWASVQLVSKTSEWLPVLAKSQWALFVLDLPLKLMRKFPKVLSASR